MVARASPEHVLAETREWIERVVVGLDLCPFAAEPLRAGRVRFRISDAETPELVASDLAEELAWLDREPRAALETSLLVHPRALLDFEVFNQFLAVGDFLLGTLDLAGRIQIVGFHPGFRFADARPEDPANATNRSPHPMLHLLREESVAEAVQVHPDPQGIPGRNAEKLRRRAQQRASVRGRSSG